MRFWLVKAQVVYRHPPNRKYIVSNVKSNAVSNVNVKLTFKVVMVDLELNDKYM